MLTVNYKESGVVKGVGVDKLRVVIDGDSFEEVSSAPARELARTTAVQQGFGNGGQCDMPITGPVGDDGKMLEGMAAIQETAPVTGFRTEFLYTNRI
jgi:hypothetical protein